MQEHNINDFVCRKDIQEINWERKSSQTSGGEKLINLEATWVQLVSKNYDIEQACVNLETEIMKIQSQQKPQIRHQDIEMEPEIEVENEDDDDDDDEEEEEGSN